VASRTAVGHAAGLEIGSETIVEMETTPALASVMIVTVGEAVVAGSPRKRLKATSLLTRPITTHPRPLIPQQMNSPSALAGGVGDAVANGVTRRLQRLRTSIAYSMSMRTAIRTRIYRQTMMRPRVGVPLISAMKAGVADSVSL
jgi:hypothetical protein